jgi:hypothetical protein
MTSEWTPNPLAAPPQPQRIRPETHWFHEAEAQGRGDGGLWFSLQLNKARAEELYHWSLSGNFGELISGGARMSPSSRTALRYALDAGKSDSIGTDIYVPTAAFGALDALPKDEITDAGLAVEGDIGDHPLPLRTSEAAKSITLPGPIPAGSPVIIAIVDDGIGIANHRFRGSATTTRVKHFLDLALVGTPTASGMVPELLGWSWKGKNNDKKDSDIETLLARYPDDEEQVYRELGLIGHPTLVAAAERRLRQPLRAAVSHGTHMLDIAAGFDWRRAEKENGTKNEDGSPTDFEKLLNRPIIAVQLPTQVAENRSDTWLPHSLKRALDWILVKADELSDELSPDRGTGKARRLPLIVNGSFASMAGPQDGESDVERRITQFVKTYRGDGPDELCTFVLSAGNSLQLRSAAQMEVERGPSKSRSLGWRIQPDDKTPNFVEVWLPEVRGQDAKKAQGGVSTQVKVSLVPPGGAAAKQAPVIGGAIDWTIDGTVCARIYHQCFPRPHGSRECVTIAVGPTASDGNPAPLAPSGLWQIQVENTGANAKLDVDLRVHRDDVGMFSRSGARQSYFDLPEYEMFETGTGRVINDESRDSRLGTRVTRQGTLSTYAYADGVLAVGGYRRSDGEPAAYSSSGGKAERRAKHCTKDADANLPDAHGPDLAAVSEESPALGGVLAAGTYSGSTAILNGTSVAAPQVTRELADVIAEGGTLGTLKADIAASKKGHRGSRGRALREGLGRLRFRPSYPRRIDNQGTGP